MTSNFVTCWGRGRGEGGDKNILRGKNWDVFPGKCAQVRRTERVYVDVSRVSVRCTGQAINKVKGKVVGIWGRIWQHGVTCRPAILASPKLHLGSYKWDFGKGTTKQVYVITNMYGGLLWILCLLSDVRCNDRSKVGAAKYKKYILFFVALKSPVVTICTAQWSLYVLPSGHYMYPQWSLYVPHSGHICTAQWSLYVPHSGHYMYHTVVTICTAQWSYMYCTVVTIFTAHW